MNVMARRKRCDRNSFDAPVAQMDQSNSLLRSRLEVRVLPGALRDSDAFSRVGTDSSTAEPPAFNREVAGSSPARCMDVCESEKRFGSPIGKRRLAQNEEVAGSNPARTTVTRARKPDWLLMALLFAQQFKGF